MYRFLKKHYIKYIKTKEKYKDYMSLPPNINETMNKILYNQNLIINC